MNCCGWAECLDEIFDASVARAELEDYRRQGPRATTRILLEGLRATGVGDATLLDIGGGVGVVQHELVASGAASVIAVDASSSYLRTAEEEARRRGYANRARYVHDDFARVAGTIAPADLVTLDRVICCYPDLEARLGAAADRTRRVLGLVYPRDAWWVRLGAAAHNAWRRLVGDPDRAWVHRRMSIDLTLARRGLTRIFDHRRLYWQISLFGKESIENSSPDADGPHRTPDGS